MQYLSKNYRSKKAAREAVAAGENVSICVVEPQISARQVKSKKHGLVTEHTITGPWYPEPHKWYGNARINRDGQIVEIV